MRIGRESDLGGEYEVYTLDRALNHKIEVFEIGSEDKMVLEMPEEEQRLLKDLLIRQEIV
jgi:hypothetical protein